MTTIDQQDLDSVDLADPGVWDDGPPYDLFARMQREAPVHFSAQHNLPDEGGFWSITRFDDVRTVSRDHRTFSSERRGIFHMDDVGDQVELFAVGDAVERAVDDLFDVPFVRADRLRGELLDHQRLESVVTRRIHRNQLQPLHI